MGFGVLRRIGLAWAAFAALTGCGSLANDIVTGSVSGTTANGAPVVGEVSLRDSTGITLRPVTVSSASTFRVLLTGLIPPFIFRASGVANGAAVSLVGVTDQPGAMNATPLTHLAVAIAYGGNPETAFQNWGGINTVSLADVGLAMADIKSQIQPVLDAFSESDTDLMSAPFDAGPDPTARVVVDPKPDGLGMDGVYQVLEMTFITDPDVVDSYIGYTITNRSTGSSFSDDLDLQTPPVSGLPASDAISTQVPAPAVEPFVPESTGTGTSTPTVGAAP